MTTTFILKDLSDVFYHGGFSIPGLFNLDPLEQYLYLKEKAARRELKITQKIGHGTFREQIELNQASRSGLQVQSSKIESRKGYKLATFEIEI